tara:strand:+ start:110 stop:490 length:381 start_codon:yes stop_codon:yes gene_type:complete
MIGFAMFGTNDLIKSSDFYDKTLAPLEIVKRNIDQSFVGYANKHNLNEIIFYITKPYDQKNATYGNGTMLAFKAKSKEIVNESHSVALKNGATNEGSPGLRKGYGNVYYSYIRDLDQNKICIYSED